MKKCPKCSRTYADDGFTFCLEDGALLSASYQPNKQEPVSTIQNSAPPPTVALPAERVKEIDSTRKGEPALPPPLTGAQPQARGPEWRADFPLQSPRKSKLLYILPVGVVAILAVAVLMFLSYRRGQCPRISVNCSQSASYAYCYLHNDRTSSQHFEASASLASLRVILGLQQAAPPPGVENISWTSSAGTVLAPNGSSAQIDITGLSEKQITVTAKYTSGSFLCPNQSSASFVIGPPSR